MFENFLNNTKALTALEPRKWRFKISTPSLVALSCGWNLEDVDVAAKILILMFKTSFHLI